MDFKNTPQYSGISIPAAKLPLGPDKLRKVIDELDVENSPRYRRKADGRTWCNIFVTDVLDAFNYPPSHWVPADGDVSRGGDGVDMVELNANQMLRWMISHGGNFGWIHTDREAAMDAAARGHVVIVGYDSRSVKPGHVAVLLPEGTIAQAGRQNFVGKTIREGFGDLPVQFWVQIRGGSHGEE